MAELFTATATALGGRAGHVQSSDGVVDFNMTMPKAIGGEGKSGATNPETLFAAGYAACFGGALELVARNAGVNLPQSNITAAVTLNKDDSGFFISVKLTAALPGLDRATAEKLVHEAHQVCPYSKATRNNVQVDLDVK